MRARSPAILLAALIAAGGGAAGSPLGTGEAQALQRDGSGAERERGRWLTARVTEPLRLRARPGGRPLARVRPRTQFGSPTVLSVVRRRKGWLQVVATELRNGRRGWVPLRKVGVGYTNASLHVDRSRRQVSLRRHGRVLRRFPVAIGAPGTPTPRGRFAVTDRLRLKPVGPYGIGAIVLSGHQPRLVPGWSGGDRLAIHGTPHESTIGKATSRGCLRAPARPLRRLLRRVPLGAPVFVTD